MKVILVVSGVDGDDRDNRDDGESDDDNAAMGRAWQLLSSELKRWTDRMVLDHRLSRTMMQRQRRKQQTTVTEAEWMAMAAEERQHM